MSGDDLEQMYQEVILEAARDPHGKERFAPDLASENASQARDAIVQASHEYCTPGESHQFNPTCGDEATVHVEVSDNEPHTIERLVWDGHGCSISQASLSVMVDLVEGKSVDEAMHLADTFHRLMIRRHVGGPGGAVCGDERNADDKPAPEAIIYSTALSVSVMERQ